MKARYFTFDILDGADPPQHGDILYPAWPAGRAWYEVREARPIESRIWHDRWKVTVRRVDPDAVRRGEGVQIGARLIGWAPKGTA